MKKIFNYIYEFFAFVVSSVPFLNAIVLCVLFITKKLALQLLFSSVLLFLQVYWLIELTNSGSNTNLLIVLLIYLISTVYCCISLISGKKIRKDKWFGDYIKEEDGNGNTENQYKLKNDNINFTDSIATYRSKNTANPYRSIKESDFTEQQANKSNILNPSPILKKYIDIYDEYSEITAIRVQKYLPKKE